MKKIYVVREINGEEIIVFPLSKNLTDGQFEKEAKSRIEALNSEKLSLEVGSKVTIGFSRKRETFNGFAALLFPMIVGLAGFFLSPLIIGLLNFPENEFSKFFITLFFLAAAIFIVYRASRNIHPISRFRIKSVL